MKKTKKLSQLSGHTGAVYCLSAGRQSHTFFSGGADGYIAEWNLQTLQQEKFAVKMGSPVFGIQYHAQKNLLAGGLFNGHLHLIDLTTKTELKNFQLSKGGVFALTMHENKLYAGGGDGVLHVIDLITNEHTLALPLNEGKIRRIHVYKNQLFISCGDGKLRILESEFYNEVRTLEAHETGVYDCMQDGNVLYTVGKDAHLRIWDTITWQQLEAIPAHNFGIYRIVNIDFETFATCSRDSTVKLWNKANLSNPLRIDYKGFKGHNRSVNDILIPELDNSLISCGDDGTIMVWKLES